MMVWKGAEIKNPFMKIAEVEAAQYESTLERAQLAFVAFML